ncbi:MAG: DUF1778 domain-containing protein [Thermomicrobiales bacterium]
MTSASTLPGSRTHAVNLRVRGDIRSLIDRAALAQGKSRSEFMIDAARRAAEDALLDQTLVRVDQETWDYFVSVLDNPPANPGLERLMRAPRPWES